MLDLRHTLTEIMILACYYDSELYITRNNFNSIKI